MIKKIDDINLINNLLSNFTSVKISDINDFMRFYVYKIDNEIVGFISYSIMYDRAELEYIFVYEGYRNKHIASSLLNIMFDECIKNNCFNITLEVRIGNDSAIKLYKKNGFKEIVIRKNYYYDEDALLMEKVLK